MSKGNMLLGYARGSVGDVVMSRVKGQQVAKARNRKPANPKTKSQMQQRASFISPVKFYTHGVQALFKFAFSDKKVTESDFNAFQRNNAKASFPVTKAENDNPAFPALGNYMMTKGKLPEIPCVAAGMPQGVVAINLGLNANPSTIAGLSAVFVSLGYAEEGDIITLVGINEVVTSASASSIVLAAGEAPKWAINQFVVDSSDTSLCSDVLPDAIIGTFHDLGYIAMKGADTLPPNALHAFAVIRSRETALGLEVSTSYLHNGGFINAYIEHRNTKAQVDKVLADWGATGDAILQGSIAKK